MKREREKGRTVGTSYGNAFDTLASPQGWLTVRSIYHLVDKRANISLCHYSYGFTRDDRVPILMIVIRSFVRSIQTHAFLVNKFPLSFLSSFFFFVLTR